MSSRSVHRATIDRYSAAIEPIHAAGRSHPHIQYPHHHDADAERYDAERPRAQSAGGRLHSVHRGDADLRAYSGRRVRIGLVAFWTVVGTLVITAGWTVVTATVVAFRGDARVKAAARRADMQSAYEDRLAEMRARIDRVTSRQLLDQDQLELKLDQIVRRQSVLEQHATTLGTLSESGGAGASGRAGRSALPVPAGAAPKASPMSGSAIFSRPMLRDAKAALPGQARGARPDDMNAMLARVTESLDRVEGRQTRMLASLEESFEAKARRLRAVLVEAGLEHTRAAESAVGGPFVPYRVAASGGSFEKQIYHINVARAQVERLIATVSAVPLRKPVDGVIETSSGFGVRLDPFNSHPAMHTGIDFRGGTGEPIRVTAAGVVTSAGWSGGYGQMVEVDHGNGVSTRYGHMSAIDVRVGQTLKAGQSVGKLGSTGRSTGPHLHYETRIGGEAVDPHRFLHAGEKSGLI